MKKRILLAMLCVCVLLSGCIAGGNYQPESFDFRYEIVEDTGEKVMIKVTAVNTGHTFRTEGDPAGYFYAVSLVNSESGFSIMNANLGAVAPLEDNYCWCERGTEIIGFFSFYLPDDAVPGYYDLSASYFGSAITFEDVYMVEE